MAAGIMEQIPRDSCRFESLGLLWTLDGDGSFGRKTADDDVAGIWDWLQSMAGMCGQKMSEVTEEDIAKALESGEGGSLMGQKPCLAALDREIFTTLTASGGNQSTKNDTWSRRRFDEWRLQNGMPTSKAIETMDIKALASQLPTFFQQVMKHNGDHYPLESLLGFYRGFTRIMRKAQEARICETRVIETPFDMRANPLFQRTGVAMLEAMRRSVLAGANKRRKKSAVVSWVNEEALLADKDHQATHPYGCFRRWTYYCISRFQIRGGKELYNLMDCDFHESRDKDGDYIIYGEGLLKNQDSSTTAPANPAALKATTRGTVKRVKVEPLRVPVKCYQVDVIHTYKQFMKHHPVKVGDEVGKPRHLFLQPIGNPVTNAWFAKSHVSERVLISLFKSMAVVAGVNVKDISNKPGRPILPSPAVGEASPTMASRGTLVPGYGLYARYELNADLQKHIAQSDMKEDFGVTGGKRRLQDAFGDDSRKEDINQQSPGTSSARSEPDLVCIAPLVDGADKGGFEAMVDSEVQQNGEVNVATAGPGQSTVNKLRIARNQIKELELTLSDKMGFNCQSLQDMLQVALFQLKNLETTLHSILYTGMEPKSSCKEVKEWLMEANSWQVEAVWSRRLAEISCGGKKLTRSRLKSKCPRLCLQSRLQDSLTVVYSTALGGLILRTALLAQIKQHTRSR